MKLRKYFILYFFTLRDISLFNIFKRLKYEIKIYFIKINFSSFIAKYRENYEYVEWNEKVLIINPKNINYQEKNVFEGKDIEISFLNKTEKINLPINWNISKVSKLWRFNLHYFSWLRNFLNVSYKEGLTEYSFKRNIYLIDSWIDFNLNNYGDGWHSYTLSLRIRNWIWLFRFFPNLISNKIKKVLWIQLNWLYENREYHLGGNHLLENLITLVLGSLQFKGKIAESIFSECMSELSDELQKQILCDGGHQERCCSYHLILLQNLTELGLAIQSYKNIRPIWLVESINSMNKWAYNVKLKDNNYPRFNDSIYSEEINIEKIINLSFSYLEQNLFVKRSDLFHFKLCEYTFKNNNVRLKRSSPNKLKYKLPKILDLEETGWCILRPNKSWEIIFKSGESGPKNLLGHSHSDLYTFDIFYEGKLLTGETGTSKYEFSEIRKYERSANSHNVMQLTVKDKKNIEKIKNWHEPLEVWNSFRVARKPKIINRSFGKNIDNVLWVKGLYAPYQNYIKNIERIMEFKILKNNCLEVSIQDNVFSKCDIYWKINLHFSPNFNFSNFKLENLQNSKIIKKKWINSWTAYEFGKRIPSKTLLIFGNFKKGNNTNKLKLILDPSEHIL